MSNYVVKYLEYFKRGNRFNPEHYFDIHFRPTTHNHVNYNNILPDYNGVVPLSKEFFKYTYKLYDNGIYIGNDFYVTDLPPLYMYTLFPRRHMKKHSITMTYDRSDSLHYSQAYYPQWLYTVEELTPGNDAYKVPQIEESMMNMEYTYLWNRMMWVDYIDYRCNLIVNGEILFNNVDYEILSPRLIYFKTINFKKFYNDKIDEIYEGKDNIDFKTLEVIVEYPGILEEEVIESANNTSRLQKMYEQEEVKRKIFSYKSDSIFNREADSKYEHLIIDGFANMSILMNAQYLYDIPVDKLPKPYPRLVFPCQKDLLSTIRIPRFDNYAHKYHENVFRHHVMITKFFQTEDIVEGHANNYGINWLRELTTEFPEFITYIGKENRLTWAELDALDKTWDEIDAGAWETAEGNKLFENYHIDTASRPVNLYKAPINFNYKDEDTRLEFINRLTELYKMNDTTDKEKRAKAKAIEEFNEYYSRPLVKEENGKITTLFSAPDLNKPREIVLPAETPLNRVMTNHAIFTAYYYTNGKIFNSYYNYDRIFHDNNDLVDKRIIDGYSLGFPYLFGNRKNIIASQIEIDSLMCNGIPMNFVCNPYKDVFNKEDDLEYFSVEQPPLPPNTDIVIPPKHDLSPGIELKHRWINIIPNVLIDDRPVELTFESKGHKTIRQLLTQYNYSAYKVTGYYYILGDNKYKVDLDTDIDEISYLPLVGNRFNTKPPLLVPDYGHYNVNIHFGPTIKHTGNPTDKDIFEDWVNTNDTILHYEVPKIDTANIIEGLKKNYPNLLINHLIHPEINRTNIDNDLNDKLNGESLYFKYTPDSELRVSEMNGDEKLKDYIIADTFPEDMIKRGKDLDLYYGINEEDKIIEGKYIRFFNKPGLGALYITPSPKYKIPSKYIPYMNIFSLTSTRDNLLIPQKDLVEYYIPLSGDRNKPFLDYILNNKYMKENHIFNRRYLEYKRRSDLRDHIESIKNANRYNIIIKDKTAGTEEVYNTQVHDKYDLTKDISLTDHTNLYMDNPYKISMKNIKTQKSAFVYKPVLMDIFNLGNISINDTYKRESKIPVWIYDGADIDNANFIERKNDFWEMREISIYSNVDDMPDNVLGVGYNYFKYKYDRSNVLVFRLNDKVQHFLQNHDDVKEIDNLNRLIEDGEFKPVTLANLRFRDGFFTYTGTDPDEVRDLEIQVKNLKKYKDEPLYYYYDNKLLRVIDTEALINTLVYLLNTNKTTSDYDISIEQDDFGSIDYNTLGPRYEIGTQMFDEASRNLDLLFKWRDTYGWFEYVPYYITISDFTKESNKYIDVFMKRADLRVRVKLHDKVKSKTINLINRIAQNESEEFIIQGSENYTFIVSKNINFDLLKDYLKSVDLNNFDKEETVVYAIDPLDGTRIKLDNPGTLYDALYEVGRRDNQKMTRQPILEVVYTLKVNSKVNIDYIPEGLNAEDYKAHLFTHRNEIGIKYGMSSHIPLTEIDAYLIDSGIVDYNKLHPVEEPKPPVVTPDPPTDPDTEDKDKENTGTDSGEGNSAENTDTGSTETGGDNHVDTTEPDTSEKDKTDNTGDKDAGVNPKEPDTSGTGETTDNSHTEPIEPKEPDDPKPAPQPDPEPVPTPTVPDTPPAPPAEPDFKKHVFYVNPISFKTMYKVDTSRKNDSRVDDALAVFRHDFAAEELHDLELHIYMDAAENSDAVPFEDFPKVYKNFDNTEIDVNLIRSELSYKYMLDNSNGGLYGKEHFIMGSSGYIWMIRKLWSEYNSYTNKGGRLLYNLLKNFFIPGNENNLVFTVKSFIEMVKRDAKSLETATTPEDVMKVLNKYGVSRLYERILYYTSGYFQHDKTLFYDPFDIYTEGGMYIAEIYNTPLEENDELWEFDFENEILKETPIYKHTVALKKNIAISTISEILEGPEPVGYDGFSFIPYDPSREDVQGYVPFHYVKPNGELTDVKIPILHKIAYQGNAEGNKHTLVYLFNSVDFVHPTIYATGNEYITTVQKAMIYTHAFMKLGVDFEKLHMRAEEIVRFFESPISDNDLENIYNDIAKVLTPTTNSDNKIMNHVIMF